MLSPLVHSLPLLYRNKHSCSLPLGCHRRSRGKGTLLSPTGAPNQRCRPSFVARALSGYRHNSLSCLRTRRRQAGWTPSSPLLPHHRLQFSLQRLSPTGSSSSDTTNQTTRPLTRSITRPRPSPPLILPPGSPLLRQWLIKPSTAQGSPLSTTRTALRTPTPTSSTLDTNHHRSNSQTHRLPPLVTRTSNAATAHKEHPLLLVGILGTAATADSSSSSNLPPPRARTPLPPLLPPTPPPANHPFLPTRAAAFQLRKARGRSSSRRRAARGAWRRRLREKEWARREVVREDSRDRRRSRESRCMIWGGRSRCSSRRSSMQKVHPFLLLFFLFFLLIRELTSPSHAQVSS